MEINILSPASSASAFYLCGLGLCFGCGGVRWFRPSVGHASLGLNEGWYLAKGALPSERDLWDEEAPRTASEGRVPCSTPQPCMTDLPAGTWLEAALLTPTPWGLESSPAALTHPGISHGASRTKVGGGATPGTSTIQGLEWQILQPGAQDRSPSPSLSYTPGTLAW